MNLVTQPEGSNLCGQACVATITGIGLERAISVFGTRGCTTTKQVVAALRKLGIPCADTLTRIKGQSKPPLCMVVLHFAGEKFKHWTVYHQGLYYDPSMGIGDTYSEGVRETSYLEIYAKEAL